MFTELDWLPAVPVELRQRMRAIRDDIAAGVLESVEAGLRTVAATALDLSQLEKMATTIDSWRTASVGPSGLTQLKLGLLTTGTQDFIAPAIRATGLRHGLLIDIVLSGYGSAAQAAIDPGSPMRVAAPDIVLVASDPRSLGIDRFIADLAAAAAAVDAAAASLRATIDGLRAWVRGAVLVETVVPPVEPLFGNFDRLQPGSPFAMAAEINARIAGWARAGEVTLVDTARLAASVGLERWDDPARWHVAKLRFAIELTPLYADLVCRVLAAIAGKARKCLVLDLDNTLWGGVIGDDGLDGIKLGQGSGAGEAFVAIQSMALQLQQRGIVLAVCSKNERDAALLPFREHPDMLLRERDIAVFVANWTDKAANLRHIATVLNIGLDALVFLDDNPAERAQVRLELPMVAVPELPDDPALYPRTLLAAGYFEAVAFVAEDALRAGDYQAQSERQQLASTSNVAGYLQSLDMVCQLQPFDSIGRARIAQLINKSNQFNLTTRRYTDVEVSAIASDPRRFALQVRLADRFGDNGMISVIIFDRDGDRWINDTWLMSCRVLGRRVEEAILAHVAAAARAEGAKVLIGSYIPSGRNAIVADHYRKLGFTEIAGDGDGTRWKLDLVTYSAPELPMTIVAKHPEPALHAV